MSNTKKNNLFPILIIILFLCPAICPADVEGIVKGTIQMYLYEEGTGAEELGDNMIYASIGDTISIDVFLRNFRQEQVTGIDIFLTVDEEYFDIVSNGKRRDGSFTPFTQGDFLKSAGGNLLDLVGNYSHGDSLTANDNPISGWQLDYIEQTGPDIGFGRPYSLLRYGVGARFKLIAKAPGDSLSISLDRDAFYERESRYHKPGSNDSYSYKTFNTCYITVSGATINPPFPDILMEPASSDSTIDLDEHIGISSIPDSLFNWTATGNKDISVSIDSLTHVVTFTAPVGFKGFEDITFTVGSDNEPDMVSDTMRVSVGYAPEFYESTFPDTIFIYEDSLQVVLNLWSIVEDKDNVFETLLWEFSTGGSVAATKSGSSLVLKSALNFNGADSLEITVRDDMGLEDTITRPIWVYPVNDPPTLTGLPDVKFERTKSIELDLSPYADDIDDDSLTVNYNSPENFLISIDGMTLTITEAAGFVGSEELILMVNDPSGLSAADTLIAEVTPLTGLPVWSQIPKIGFAQNQSFSNLIIWDYVSDPDGETSELKFEFSNYDDVENPSVSSSNGRLYLYDTDNTPGWDLITVTAVDYDNNKASTQFLVFIGPADGTPIVAAIPDTTIRAGTVSEWIDLDNYYYDIDNTDSEMTWTWSHAASESLVVVDIDPLFREVALRTVNPDAAGSDRILFTVTDPGGKFASDESLIKILSETRPVLDMPQKIGFVTGVGKTIDIDEYAADPDFDNSELDWSWNGNVNIDIAVDTDDTTSTMPVNFSSPDNWTGWEKVYFAIQNPLAGSAIDSTLVFSVPADGSPVIGGFSEVRIKAGLCDSLNIDLDDYFYDYDTDERFMTWTVTSGDSITVTLDPLTNEITFCAPSSTFEGQETVTITVSDGVNSDSMDVNVIVYGAYIGDVFSMMLFRNPMQGDYMDIYISSERDILGLPTLEVMVVGDSTNVVMRVVSDDSLNYYHGNYLLPYDASLGLQQDAIILASGTTSSGKAVQDTLGFSYGRYGQSGGKISLGAMTVDVPENALSEIEMISLTSQSVENGAAGKISADEIIFKGDVYTLGPSKLNSHIPMDVGFSVCCRADGAGMYRLESDGWKFAGGAVTDNILRSETFSGGEYRVGFDRVSPQIDLVSSKGRIVTFSAADYGSGIDISSIRILYEGSYLEFEYDAEKSLVNVELPDIYSDTDVSLDVFVSDRSGNETAEFLDVTIEPLPGQFIVEQNVPNPFNPMTAITFINTSGQQVKIEIYDILGRKVKVLTDDFYSPGTHKIIWNAVDEAGRTVSNGTYIYTVVSGSNIITRKMLFLK